MRAKVSVLPTLQHLKIFVGRMFLSFNNNSTRLIKKFFLLIVVAKM